MTDLDRMILAARQIGEVVGEDLLDNIGLDNKGRAWMDLEDTTSGGWCPVFLTHADALDLLTARVWRAVQGWAAADTLAYEADWHNDGGLTVKIYTRGAYPDLPSAVAAIHGWWRSQQPVEDKH